jgi:hypothetical protein
MEEDLKSYGLANIVHNFVRDVKDYFRDGVDRVRSVFRPSTSAAEAADPEEQPGDPQADNAGVDSSSLGPSKTS